MSFLRHREEAANQSGGQVSCVMKPFSRFIPQIEMCHEYIDLRPQQRLDHTNARRDVVSVREGALAVEAVLPIGRRHILDFLLPGDMVTPSSLLSSSAFPAISIRAVTRAALVCVDHRATASADRVPDEYWETLFAQAQAQLARANAHRLMIGHLDTTSRVASFLLAIALRTCGGAQSNLRFALPMSRDDIADYLAMNSDTLSRIMMRFESLALIERVNRREVHVDDINKLKRHSPIAPLLSSAFELRRPQYAI